MTFGERTTAAARWSRVAVVVAIVGAVLSACSGSSARPDVTVMTRNMYFGADLSPLFGATASQLGPGASAAYQQLQRSNIPDRLQADAQEIASAKPDLVALQEAVLWSITPTGQGTRVAYDFVSGLQADLVRLGTPYTVAASSNGFGGTLPVPEVGAVTLQDRDVILVRGHDSRLSVSNPSSGTFKEALTVHVAGVPITVKRGWTAVDVNAGGRRFRVIATHLEAYGDSVRDAQAQELIGLVRDGTGAAVVLGDVNSPAEGTGSQTYDAVRRAGLGDAWAAVNGGAAGFTCCRSADVRSGTLDQRIDMIFTWGAFGVTRAWVVGSSPSDRTAGGLWPSDHAGVVATLRPPG